MGTHETDDEEWARLERVAALPAFIECAGMTALAVESALRPALEGHRKQSCRHAADAQRGVGRVPVLCLSHPDRLLCDDAEGRVGCGGCARAHLSGEHADGAPATCFVCEQPIDELVRTPVFAVVRLHRPLTVHTDRNDAYQYTDELRTLPVAHLCPRHASMHSRPWVVHWPMTEHLAPEDVTRRTS